MQLMNIWTAALKLRAGKSPISMLKATGISLICIYVWYRSTFHGCGTCSMGKVVDADLRVKGVRNLRVVDASVIPIAIGAHIQAVVYALAEQAAVITSQGREV